MLKEQDDLIELIIEWIIHPEDIGGACQQLSVLEVFEIVEALILEHLCNNSTNDRLKKYLPNYDIVFLPLKLKEAALEYNSKTQFLCRKYIPPTFKEIRHVLNISVINAISSQIQMVTFDADDTIYEDGGSICKKSPMTEIIVNLLKRGLVVSLVTAAAYPGNPERFEKRLHGILEALSELPPPMIARFLVMGGECNYLHKTMVEEVSGNVRLIQVDPVKWKDGRGVRWTEEDITDLLNKAEKSLNDTMKLLKLPGEVLRKERACGIINTGEKRLTYENLEEITLTVQKALESCSVPHCAFNGGKDVWVDVGNKALGISALQKFVPSLLPQSDNLLMQKSLSAANCLHVGDRFTQTGNDTRSREVSVTAWVSNPEETVFLMNLLIQCLDDKKLNSNE